MGTAGVEGAYQSMITGEVDEIWARDHHELWLQEVNAKAAGARSGGAK
jgi:formate dehydrogenase subunit gamma